MTAFHLPDIRVLAVLAGIFVLLVAASLLVFFRRDRFAEATLRELHLRIRTWWIIVGLFTAAMTLPKLAALAFFLLVSLLAFREYLAMAKPRPEDQKVVALAYAVLVVQYYWAAIGWYGMFIIFIPVYAFLFLPLRMVLIGETRDFLRAAATLQWGLMITGLSISHLAYLLILPPPDGTGPGGPGLVLCLVVLTQLNDVAQYVWGKLTGRHKAVPTVSPGKTLEGLAGGVVTTTVLALLLGPVLTPLSVFHSLLAGIMISLGGFAGDVTISALKRDIGVKDSGDILPGHGGLLDRVDSLTVTAPLFFHFVRYLYY